MPPKRKSSRILPHGVPVDTLLFVALNAPNLPVRPFEQISLAASSTSGSSPMNFARLQALGFRQAKRSKLSRRRLATMYIPIRDSMSGIGQDSREAQTRG